MDEYEQFGPEVTPGEPEKEPAEPAPSPAPAAPRKRSRVAEEILDWGRSIVIAVALALVIKATVVQAYMIPTGSMKPTIVPFDRVFGNRFIYHIHKPQRGDIIAFKPPDGVSEDNIPFLKRVIAVEGDTVEVRRGNRVYVNGQLLNEPYAVFDPNSEMTVVPPLRVPRGDLFVLGDNRGHSYDSSMWRTPFLPVDNVQAKAFFRFWPPGRIGTLY